MTICKCSAAVLALMLSIIAIATAVPITTDVQVGVIWPFTYGLDEIKVPLDLALQDIQFANILPTGIGMALMYRDSNDSQSEAVAAMMDLYTQFNTLTPIRMHAVISERSIDNTVPVSLLSTALGVPVISTKTNSPTLNDRTSYAYTLRTPVNDNFLGDGIIQMMAQFNWLRFAILHSDDDDGRGLLDYMIKNPLPGADISVFSIPSNASLSAPVISKALDSIESSDIRVILLHGSQSLAVLQAAAPRGLMDDVHVWLGTHWCTAETIKAIGGDALLGTTCVAPASPKNSGYSSWKSRLAAFNSTSSFYTKATETDFLNAAYAYDSLFTIAYGIRDFHASGRPLIGSQLYTMFSRVNFTGVSDLVTYNSSTGDRNPQVDILNFNPSTNSYAVRGSYDYVSQTLNIADADFIWSSGSSHVPKDRPQVYINDDPLLDTTDARIIVLAYVISVLGAWTTLILLEQAISLKQTQQNKEAYIWVAASSIAMGVSGIFALNYIAFSALQLDTVPVYYHAGPFVAACILAFLLSFASLFISITDIKKREKYSHEDSSEITDTSSLSKPRTSTASENKNNKAGSTTNANKSSKHSRRTIIGKIRNILSGVSLRLVAGGLFMGLGIVFTQIIGIYGFIGNFDFQVDWNHVVGSIFFAWGLSLLPLLMFFHLTKSSIRFVGAFIMGGVTLGSNQIVSSGLTYTYNFRSAEPSYFTDEGIEGTTIFSIVFAAVAAVICFVLMAINVAKLRISRNTLDRVLVSVQNQMTKLETQIEEERKEKIKIQEQMEFSRKTIEIINLCRPLYRSYAMALALADCDTTIANSFLSSSLYENLTQKSKTTAQKSRNESSTDKSEKSKAGNANSVTKQPKPSESKKPSVKAGGERSIISDPNAVNDNANTNITPAETEKNPSNLISPASEKGAMIKAPTRRSESEFNFIHCKKNEKTILRYLNEFAPILSLENTALQARLLADIKLVHLLSHPATFELLKDSLNKQFTPENLTLYCDIQRYRLIENQSVRKIIAEEIFTLFIANSAKYEVNISSFMKDSIEKRMQNEKYSSDLFDEVEKEILRLITTNNWDLFISSPQFRMAALILSHVTVNKSNNLTNGATTDNKAQAGTVAPYGNSAVPPKKGIENAPVSKISTSKH